MHREAAPVRALLGYAPRVVMHAGTRTYRARASLAVALSIGAALSAGGCRGDRVEGTDAGLDARFDAGPPPDGAPSDAGRGDVGPLTRPRDAGHGDAAYPGPCGDCAVLDGPCQIGRCDVETAMCFAELMPEGTTCDDGRECTTGETCTAIGGCVGTPREIGTACDDGNACTDDDACADFGLCEGAPRDCSALDAPCARGVCSDGACTARVRIDCTACGDPGDTCVAGACGPPPHPLTWSFDAGLPPSWASEGDAAWVAAPGEGRMGGTALSTPPLGDGRLTTAVLRVVTRRPAVLSFWYRVSSEPGWDFFRVGVTGLSFVPTIPPVSGEVGWTQQTVDLRMPGAHEVRFIYDKDGSLGAGEDRVLLDEVMLISSDDTMSVELEPGPILEGFEGPDLPPGARTGPSAWFIDPSQAFEGSASAASGELPDDMAGGAMTDLELDVMSAENEAVEVWARTNSETNYDYFELLVDGVVAQRLSGVHEWTRLAAPLGPAGPHVITLRYRKDASIAPPADRVWVDALRIAPILSGMSDRPSVCL